MSTSFSDLMASIAEKGRQFLRTSPDPPGVRKGAGLIEMCDDLLSGRGEASGTALARAALDRYAVLDPEARVAFFKALARDFGATPSRLEEAARAWLENPTDMRASDLHYLSEPRRVELLRRLNRAPGGAAALVDMRSDLLRLIEKAPDLRILDRDFVHLLTSWFNRGFLVLRRIDWSSPAMILAKLIKYEAVHEIRDWDDLRRRIDPPDRRCYAFFHPALVDEPLIFLEVALTDEMPRAIVPLLAPDREVVPPNRARFAVFYSISNCLAGLAGISFGNFLIKQAVEELRKELPRLEGFVTLSPVPRFLTWLLDNRDALALSPEQSALLERLFSPDWANDESLAASLRALVEPLAARYFIEARTSDGRVVDPVARFHLGNGATLEQIHWLGDRSPRAMAESAGLMVNYLYDLDRIEINHERYANAREVIASAAVRRLLRAQPKLKSTGALSTASASAAAQDSRNHDE